MDGRVAVLIFVNTSTQEAAAFSEFSKLSTLTTTDHNKGGVIALDHHLYNKLEQCM